MTFYPFPELAKFMSILEISAVMSLPRGAFPQLPYIKGDPPSQCPYLLNAIFATSEQLELFVIVCLHERNKYSYDSTQVGNIMQLSPTHTHQKYELALFLSFYPTG